MKRVVDRYLQNWRAESGRKPLLIRGARQVGKTYTARALGDFFNELVEVNFERMPAFGRIPIEVKSGIHGKLKSIRLFLEKNRALSPKCH